MDAGWQMLEDGRRHARRRRRVHTPGRRAGRRRRGAAARAAGSRGLRRPARSSRSTPTRPWSRGEAIARGAAIVNDVSALQYDQDLAGVVAESGAAVVLMHNRGRSGTCTAKRSTTTRQRPFATSSSVHRRRVAAGVRRDQVIVDPGFGFAKKAQHSYQALAALDRIAALGRPILAGPSRKSFLRAAIGDVPPDERDWATAAAVAASALMGAHIVQSARRARDGSGGQVADAILAARSSPAP
jgi:dihydropteroate synthase